MSTLINYDFINLRDTIKEIVDDLLTNDKCYKHDINDHEFFQSCIKLTETMNLEPELKLLFEKSDQNHIMIAYLYGMHTLDIYDLVKNIILNTIENGIDNTVIKLNSLFYNKDIAYHYFTLLGIKIKEEYKIEDDIFLIPIDKKDNLKIIDNSTDKISKHIVNDVYTPHTAIIIKNKINIEQRNINTIPEFNDNLAYKIEMLTLLISLLTKKGCTIFEEYTAFNDCLLTSPASSGMSDCKFFPPFSVGVDININLLIELLNDINNFIVDIEHLKMILTRFSYACFKNNFMDSAIDLRVVMEALFVREKKKDMSYTHLVSERAALFLENDLLQRKIVFDHFKKSYGLCSDIIHGSYNHKDQDKEKLEQLKEHCANAIIKTIKNRRFYTKNDWDELILS